MTAASQSFAQQIQDFLLLLTQKERFVIERRFNLDKKERATLEEIGKHYSVTRERIRQIEKNALNKLRRNLENGPLSVVGDKAYECLLANGGVMVEDEMLAELINLDSGYELESLQLILSIDKRFSKVPNTVNFYPFLKVNELEESKIYDICKKSFSALRKNFDVMSLDELYKAVVEAKGVNMEKGTYGAALMIDKKIKLVSTDKIGLIEWRHINPRTLRDKIYFVLREHKSPLHFVDIANRIIDYAFDKKKINLQAVHNELIRHGDFILIGRGIYGLKEWGYKPGTVAEIIADLLKEKEVMSQDEIIESVLKQRQVKPITIILSLKNKDQFVRVGRKQYSLTKA